MSRNEQDIHGCQINACKIIRTLNRAEKDNLQLNPINEHTWLVYYQKRWTQQFKDNTTERKFEQSAENCVDSITIEELETTIKTLKPRKSPGLDWINNEFYKLATRRFLYKFLNFLNVCLFYGDLPEERKTANFIPLHKKLKYFR
jgi:hypothetical protein